MLLACEGAFAAQVCDLTLTACPKQLPAGPLLVPMDVISLDARIPYCQETGSVTTPAKTSIVFIIDNSGSMSMGFDFSDAQENDPEEARFSVVSSLLDLIASTHPGTEVGLVAFSRRLQFDHRDNALFKTAFPNDTTQHDSYMPLVALNHVFADGRTGLDTLKALLKHNEDGDMLYATKQPSSRDNTSALVQTTGGPEFSMRPGTDITLGFDAAKLAMLDSKAAKEQQYFIFLSDGAPGGLDVGRTQFEDDFEQGTNTPTTFTVYFTGGGQVPATIRTMTTNIQGNGYSTSNANSAYFSVSAPATELQGVLQNSVISRILTTVPTQGKSVVVSANGAVQTTTTRGDSTHFLISNRMALAAGATNLQFSYAHTFLDNSVSPPANKDTLITYTLSVQRSPQAGPLPAMVTKTCRDQAVLSLHSGGQSLSTVTTSHATLEARLTPTAGQTCANCGVQVSLTGSQDKENLSLVPAGGAYSVSFGRQEGATPVPGDVILQHVASDSIVLTWINPENGLDVVRRSWPYQSQPSSLALFSGGVEIAAVTADMSALEVRLTRPAGAPCAGCNVEIAASGSADRETRPLAASGATFNGTFVRLESATPVPGDGALQHVGADSIVITWVNPANPADRVSRGYPYVSIAPTLALFSGGKELDTVTSAHERLEIRLTLPGGEPCKGCIVTATLTGSADQEPVTMAGTASPYLGSLTRGLGLPVSGNGKLEHLISDSLVFTYENPLNPAQRVRRSYPFVNFADIAGIVPQNTIARAPYPPPADVGQWIVSDAPNLAVRVQPGSGLCCRVLSTPADVHSQDSVRTVGIVIEASREFNLDVKVFSTMGEFVNRLAFTVPREEFAKLTPINGKESRYLRLLWNGQALSGSPVGTGAYILKTAITLLPIPGVTESTPTATKLHRVGVLR